MKNNDLFDLYVQSYRLDRDDGSEFFDIVGDIYDCPQFQSLEPYIQHADINRIQHILSVAYVSYVLAKRRGLDYVATARGAMLHDLFYFDWHNKDDGSHRLSGYRHPGFALRNAKELFELDPLQENIIIRHMWPLTPIPPAHRESMLVSMVDKYCATQEILRYRLKSRSEKFDELMRGEKP